MVILPHGLPKTVGWFGGYGFTGTMGFFTSIGIPAFLGFLAIAAETAGAVALIRDASHWTVGFRTPRSDEMYMHRDRHAALASRRRALALNVRLTGEAADLSFAASPTFHPPLSW